ncbi:MAG: hypothetical protein II979_06025 [Clostridia bacterium]|nr:hypothetical protein [Clostridia bacterium]
MKQLTLEEQRKRMDNLRYGAEHVRQALQTHRVHDYLPGQVIYNLGEYPARFSIRPTEYDEQLIRTLAEKGVELIQVHEEWNDAIHVLGADKYSSHDPEGMRAFIDLCHSYGIKILPYMSSGFFDIRDPAFSDAFAGPELHILDSAHYKYASCFTGSPEWQCFLLKNLERLLDTYGFDGLYNDMGYSGVGHLENGLIVGDPWFEDLLARIYSMVKERHGIVKVHQGTCIAPGASSKVYDYLWIGECVTDSADIRRSALFPPYVVPCPDFRFMNQSEEEAFFAKTIPFMQFQIRVDGRPVTGERAFVPGIDYTYNPANNEQVHYENVKKWYDAHPDGPHVYSEWSSIPDNPVMREKWFDYLALYRPMVTENSFVYIDIGENRITGAALPEGVHMSLFLNEECFLCVSNLGKTDAVISLAEIWEDRQTGEHLQEITVAPGGLHFLKKA